MYSVILATLLSTTAGESQQWHRRAYSGCQGYAFCYGCAGCFNCYSCGCSGWYCYNSCGNCGCWYGAYGCYGCYGCYATYYPTYVSSCHGCYSYTSCYTSYSYPVSSCCFSACHGCGVAVVGGGVIVASVTPAQGQVQVAQATTTQPQTLVAGSSSPQAAAPSAVASAPKNGPATQPVSIPTNAARITVILPAEAKLLVDDVVCPLTSDVRSFNTPTLQSGTSYFYVMKMEVEKDGRTITESRRVRMVAGQHVEVNFNVPAETQTVVLK